MAFLGGVSDPFMELNWYQTTEDKIGDMLLRCQRRRRLVAGSAHYQTPSSRPVTDSGKASSALNVDSTRAKITRSAPRIKTQAKTSPPASSRNINPAVSPQERRRGSTAVDLGGGSVSPVVDTKSRVTLDPQKTAILGGDPDCLPSTLRDVTSCVPGAEETASWEALVGGAGPPAVGACLVQSDAVLALATSPEMLNALLAASGHVEGTERQTEAEVMALVRDLQATFEKRLESRLQHELAKMNEDVCAKLDLLAHRSAISSTSPSPLIAPPPPPGPPSVPPPPPPPPPPSLTMPVPPLTPRSSLVRGAADAMKLALRRKADLRLVEKRAAVMTLVERMGTVDVSEMGAAAALLAEVDEEMDQLGLDFADAWGERLIVKRKGGGEKLPACPHHTASHCCLLTRPHCHALGLWPQARCLCTGFHFDEAERAAAARAFHRAQLLHSSVTWHARLADGAGQVRRLVEGFRSKAGSGMSRRAVIERCSAHLVIVNKTIVDVTQSEHVLATLPAMASCGIPETLHADTDELRQSTVALAEFVYEQFVNELRGFRAESPLTQRFRAHQSVAVCSAAEEVLNDARGLLGNLPAHFLPDVAAGIAELQTFITEHDLETTEEIDDEI
mgnify:CR=1 FL=1